MMYMHICYIFVINLAFSSPWQFQNFIDRKIHNLYHVKLSSQYCRFRRYILIKIFHNDNIYICISSKIRYSTLLDRYINREIFREYLPFLRRLNKSYTSYKQMSYQIDWQKYCSQKNIFEMCFKIHLKYSQYKSDVFSRH